MPLTVDQLRKELLALPTDQRDKLILSVTGDSWPSDLHTDWESELDFRMEEFRAGRAKGNTLEAFQSELVKRSQAK